MRQIVLLTIHQRIKVLETLYMCVSFFHFQAGRSAAHCTYGNFCLQTLDIFRLSVAMALLCMVDLVASLQRARRRIIFQQSTFDGNAAALFG